MKVAIYTVAKNEVDNVVPWEESTLGADGVFVADTGSTDGTVERLKNLLGWPVLRQTKVSEISIVPWRFDHARNTALDLVPGDYDVAISLDMDERLAAGWREQLEKAWTPETTRVRYDYQWSPSHTYRYDRIHARHGYRYKFPTHEALYPCGRPEIVRESDIVITQVQKPNRVFPVPGDLELCKQAVMEERCPRTLFYLAREYFFHRQWGLAYHNFEAYLNHPSSNWPQERAYAMTRLAACAKGMREHWLLKAGLEDPHQRESWTDLADHYETGNDWAGVLFAVRRGLGVKKSPQMFFTRGEDYSSTKLQDMEVLAISHLHPGVLHAVSEHPENP